MKFGQFMSYSKEKILSKNSRKTATWKLVPGPFVFAKNYAQPLLENENLKQATYIRCVLGELSKFLQISTIPYYRGVLEN